MQEAIIDFACGFFLFLFPIFLVFVVFFLEGRAEIAPLALSM